MVDEGRGGVQRAKGMKTGFFRLGCRRVEGKILLVAGNAAGALDWDGTGSVGDDGFGTKTKSLSAFALQFERQHSFGATHL